MTTVGVIGLGYVGLPLAVAFAREGCEVIAVNVDSRKIEAIEAGRSYIEDVPSEELAAVGPRIHASTRYARLAKADAVLVCVPTPLTDNREPDLGPLIECARGLSEVLQQDQLVVLEFDHLSGHHARALRAAAGGVRPSRRPRLPSGLLARARRPGAHRLHAAQHPKGAGRADRRLC